MPPKTSDDQRRAEAWRLRHEENLDYITIADRLGYADQDAAINAYVEHSAELAAAVRAATPDMSDETRAAWAWQLYEDNPRRGWIDIGIKCGYLGDTAPQEALFAVHRAGRMAITESQLLALPGGKPRNRGRRWNDRELPALLEADRTAALEQAAATPERSKRGPVT
jgi:hypothetical protein